MSVQSGSQSVNPSVTPSGAQSAASAARPSRTARRTPWYRSGTVWFWVLQVALAAFFVTSALPKFGSDPQDVAAYAQLGFPGASRYLIGILEVAGGFGLLVPRLCGAAATALVVHMSVATVVSGVRLGPGTIALPLACVLVVAVVAWYRRERTARLARAILSRARCG